MYRMFFVRCSAVSAASFLDAVEIVRSDIRREFFGHIAIG
jgi:hypothetical protein